MDPPVLLLKARTMKYNEIVLMSCAAPADEHTGISTGMSPRNLESESNYATSRRFLEVS